MSAQTQADRSAFAAAKERDGDGEYLVDLASTTEDTIRLRLIRCPACETDLSDADVASHLRTEHEPSDFGLSPRGASTGAQTADRDRAFRSSSTNE